MTLQKPNFHIPPPPLQQFTPDHPQPLGITSKASEGLLYRSKTLNLNNFIDERCPEIVNELIEHVLVNSVDEKISTLCLQYKSILSQIDELARADDNMLFEQKRKRMEITLGNQTAEKQRQEKELKGISAEIQIMKKSILSLRLLEEKEDIDNVAQYLTRQSEQIQRLRDELLSHLASLSKIKKEYEQEQEQLASHEQMEKIGEQVSAQQKRMGKLLLRKKNLEKEVKFIKRANFDMIVECRRKYDWVNEEKKRLAKAIYQKVQIKNKRAKQREEQMKKEEMKQEQGVKEQGAGGVVEKLFWMKGILGLWFVVCLVMTGEILT